MTVGDRIKNERELIGLTQEALGNLCNVRKQTIYKYETNIITNIPTDKLEVIANALDVTPGYLMGWEEKKPSVPEDEGLDTLDIEALNLFRQLWPDNRKHLLEIARSLLKAQEAVGGHSGKDS